MEISLYRTGDYEQIVQIMCACADSFFDQAINDTSKIKSLAQKFSDYACFLYATIDDEICGFASFYANNLATGEAFLSMIIVNKSFQAKGIGSFLLDRVIEESKRSGMNSVKLEVNRYNERAIRFYEKYAFQVTERVNSSVYMKLNLSGEA